MGTETSLYMVVVMLLASAVISVPSKGLQCLCEIARMEVRHWPTHHREAPGLQPPALAE